MAAEAVEAVEAVGVADKVRAAVALLGPEEAIALLDDDLALETWSRKYELPMHRVVGALMSRADDWTPPPPVRGPDIRRPDTAELLEFVKRAARLPARLRDVAALCLEDGLSLTECAARLGISRETVRVHMRRLRAVQRAAVRRDPQRV